MNLFYFPTLGTLGTQRKKKKEKEKLYSRTLQPARGVVRQINDK